MAKRKVNGIFLLDKPEGISSSNALVRTRGIYQALKGGHTGALDPLASGLLPICLGEAAKFSSFFLEGNKRYIAEGTLGIVTTTADREGEVVIEREIGDALSRLPAVLEQFKGRITQVPPIYSAIKVDGKPLYKYARKGQEVEIPKREVEIYELNLLSTTENTFTVEVYCSKGTYIRTLIENIGDALGCGAYVTKLRRTYVEGLPTNMMPLEQLSEMAKERADQNDFSQLDSMLLPIEDALSNLPRLDLSVKYAEPLSHGMRVGPRFEGITLPIEQSDVNTLMQVRCHDVFLGVAYFNEDGRLVPKRMMDPQIMQDLLQKLKNSHKA